jgi:transglutaminase-like putative cysteine protease
LTTTLENHLAAQPDPMSPAFHESTEVIDFCSPAVADLARTLGDDEPTLTAARCFQFVRDEVRHSGDHQLNPVTCKASEVLACRTGYCYAKSHLLCALLRANGIPAGLCYQRLSVDGITAPPYCLHGLNAAFLPDCGWYRMDARGNRSGIDAQFTPPIERLAFSMEIDGEYELDAIHARPLNAVIQALSDHTTWDELGQNLPDQSE